MIEHLGDKPPVENLFELQAVRDEYQIVKRENQELFEHCNDQDAQEETKQDTAQPERRVSQDQDTSTGKQKFASQDELAGKTLKIDETSKETRINSIARLAKDLRPIGKVVAILESPVRDAKLIVTLNLIDEELLNPNMIQKLNKRQ